MDTLAPSPRPTAAATPGARLPAELLRTPRLRLREFAAGDEPALQRMHQDARLRSQLIDDAPLHDTATAAQFVRRIAEVYRAWPGLGIWHCQLPGQDSAVDGDEGSDGGAFAGWFSLMPMDGHPGEVELGSRLLPAYWGSGVALDGGEALLDHAFARLGLARVWGVCDPANRGARMCLDALGFRPGAMAPYGDGGLALHHQVDAGRFRRALAQARRLRLQQAARRLRLDTLGPADQQGQEPGR